MRTVFRILLALFLAGNVAHAAHTRARLILSADTVKPGDTLWVGVDLKMDPGWHTYWKNSGDAGLPTKIDWQLPPGLSAGTVQWPLPDKFPPAEVTTYGYEGEVVLLVPLTVETNSNLPAGQVPLKAKLTWLECSADICIPGATNVATTLQIGSTTQPSADAGTINEWLAKTPQTNTLFSFQSWWEAPAKDDTRPLLIQGIQTAADIVPVEKADFFPYSSDQFEVQPLTTPLTSKTGFLFRKTVQKLSGTWPKTISGVIVIEGNHQRWGFDVTLPVADHPSSSSSSSFSSSRTSPGATPAGETPALPIMLLYAFIGGLILNIMPCVLPVIALKILGFVSEARSEPRRVRNLGFIYAFGVLISFLALAGIVIGVKAAGHHAGWGMQFSSPVFVVCLTTLVMLVALNLFGVYEIAPGGRIMNAAGQLASRHGAPGAFFNGVLATILATPCTAPYLAAALGFAFAQCAPVIVLIFLFAGLGLAAPYVLLSCSPAGLKFLPKPGVWMERFKMAMGFPMLATAIWLFNLAYGDYGKNVLWLGIFLVAVAFAAWMFGEFVQRGRKAKGIAFAIVLLVLAGDYVFALEKNLNWRNPVPPAANGSVTTIDGIAWQPWSPEAVAKAQAAGHPVLVDFTADWCLTCQVNRKLAVEVPSVEKKLKETDTVAMVADYTHFADNITAELTRYHHAGVPLVLVYSKTPGTAPAVLPQVLTPGIVADALDKAAAAK